MTFLRIELIEVQRQQRCADKRTTLAALAASASDIETSQVLSQCGHRCANVSLALTVLSRHWRDAGGTRSTRECDNSNAALTGQHF